MSQSATKTGVTLAPYQIVYRPLVTEKGYHKAEKYNQYAFEVNPLATKTQIRQAVEELFNVRVIRVNTQTRKGKPRRTRFSVGYTKDWKKAVVLVDPEHRINFF